MKNATHLGFLLILLFGARVFSAPAEAAKGTRPVDNYLVYTGTFTGKGSQGIYVYRFVLNTGKLTPLGLAAKTASPTFLAVHPNQNYLYAVNAIEDFQGQKAGSVSAFSIDHKTGKLTLLNAVSSGSARPCHVTIDRTGRYLFVANYGVGSVAALPILPDGRLGKATAFLPHSGHSVNPQRQEAPHAHSIYPAPDNRFVVSADLGTDQIYVYRFDATTGTLTPNDPPSAAVPPGTGPRHFAFDPNGKFAYAIEEMGSSLTAFSYNPERGVLKPMETISTVPKDYKGYNDCAEVFFDPRGKFLYGSNRGHDSITVFAIDPVHGTPTPIQYAHTEGKTPRGFGIDPTGSFLIAGNQDSNTLAVFRIDAATGRLSATGEIERSPSPVCVIFVPAE